MRYRAAFPLLPVLIVSLLGCEHPAPPVAPPPVPVVLLTVAREDLPVTVEEVGKVEASNSVTLLPRVGGQILSRHFEEGQAVAAGDLLYSVDPAPYETQLRSAEAHLARTRAELTYAQDEADRYAELESKRTVSRSVADQVINSATLLRETIKAQEADVAQARLNLDYCRILSPIPGRSGAYLANEGAFVEAYRTPLVVVNQIDPVEIVFALPEARLPEVLAALDAGRLDVTATVTASGVARDGGVVNFIDNTVNPATGTIELKARFPNPDTAFWPGQFVRVRLVLRTIRDAIMVPTEAVVATARAPSVFVVGADQSVELRPVQIAETLDGRTRISEGLSPGESVVTSGQNKLKPGSLVQAVAP